MRNGTGYDALVLLLYISVTRKAYSLYETCLQGIMVVVLNTTPMIPRRGIL